MPVTLIMYIFIYTFSKMSKTWSLSSRCSKFIGITHIKIKSGELNDRKGYNVVVQVDG